MRVVNFRTTFAIFFDRQLLPLTPHVEQSQNVVEDLMQTQLRCRTTAASGKMRQDKCFELRKAQLRWNRLPALTSSHSGHPENWTIAYPVSAAENPGLQRLADKFACLEKTATSRKNEVWLNPERVQPEELRQFA